MNETNKPDCAVHPKEVAGLKPPELSKAIVGMHYEALAELFACLHLDFKKAGYNDFGNGLPLLNGHQQMISAYMLKSESHAKQLWEISKQFMEPKTN